MQQSKKSQEPVAESAPSIEEKIRTWLGRELQTKYLKQLGVLLLIIGLVVAVVTYQGQNSTSKAKDQNKKLGPAFVYLNNNQLDSAEVFLQHFLSGSHKDIVKAKAYLLLGKVQYLQANYQKALASYQRVKDTKLDQAVIQSGALHGAAACHIQLKDYPQAITLLEEYVSRYMKRPDSPKERNEPGAPQDINPQVPDVLWKLALCYRQVDKTEKARDASHKIIRVYGDTEEAQKAKRFLLTL